MNNRHFFLVTFVLILMVLVRAPQYLAADATLTADEAVNLISQKFFIEEGVFAFWQLGARYVGLTESFFMLPFVGFFGWSALSLKLAGLIIYGIYAIVLMSAVRQLTPLSKVAMAAYVIFPQPHLFFLSNDVRGGYFLASLLGALFVYFVYVHREKMDARFWVMAFLFLCLNHYTYRFSHVFVPVAALIVFVERKKTWRTLLAVVTLLALPVLASLPVEALGEFVASRSVESIDSFSDRSKAQLVKFSEWDDRFGYVFWQLWPRSWGSAFAPTGWVQKGLFVFFLLSILGLAYRGLSGARENRVFIYIGFHVLFCSVLIWLTPYARWDYGQRFFTAFYPAIALGVVVLLRRHRKAGWGVILLATFFAFETYRDIQSRNLIGKQPAFLGAMNFLINNRNTCFFADYETAYRMTVVSGFKVWGHTDNWPRVAKYRDCAESASPVILVLENQTQAAASAFLPDEEFASEQVLYSDDHYTVTSLKRKDTSPP